MAIRRTIPVALAGSCTCFVAALCAPTVAQAWRRRQVGAHREPCADDTCAWCMDLTDVAWAEEAGAEPEAPALPGRGPYVLATAIALTAEGTLEAQALATLLSESHGSARVLRAAYGGSMALAAELPGDRAAHETVDLLNKALREAAARAGR